MKVASTLFVSLLCLSAKAGDVITDKLIDAIGSIESGNNSQAIGDRGSARGEFQMHRPAWNQVSKIRIKQKRLTFSWSYAHDPVIGRAYAVDYIKWISTELERRLKRKPEAWEIYASYNIGLDGFESRGFNFDALPAHTKDLCSRLSNLLTLGSIRRQ